MPHCRPHSAYFGSALITEWLQCGEEGLDCGSLLDDAVQLSKKGIASFRQALELRDKLLSCRTRSGCGFCEPASYDEITGALPSKRHKLDAGYNPATCRDQIHGAWLGLIIGSLDAKGIAASGDAIDKRVDFPVLWLHTLREHGPFPSPGLLLSKMMGHLPVARLFGAEAAAYRNGGLGFLPPETATFCNPWREWDGGLYRGLLWGMLYHGNPREAAKAAYGDVSISHTGNGVYAGMFAAALLASAAACASLRTTVESAIDEIPAGCRLRRAIDEALRWRDEGLSGEGIILKIQKRYHKLEGGLSPEFYRSHAIPNTVIAILSFLDSGYDMNRTIISAGQHNFDSSASAALAASAIGMMTGASHIALELQGLTGNHISTGVLNYGHTSIDCLARGTIEVMGMAQHSKRTI